VVAGPSADATVQDRIIYRNARGPRLVARPMELTQVSARMFAKLVLTAVVVTAGVRWIAARPRGAPSYYMVDELIASGLRAHAGEIVRVHGFVEAGSLERMYGDDLLHRFRLIWHGVGLPVQASGPVPDTFRDQAEVIVTGQLVDRDGWRIEGTAVIARCPGKYDGAPPRPDLPAFK
jgi:cytochrome c-type biogenesis protein CcmE